MNVGTLDGVFPLVPPPQPRQPLISPNAATRRGGNLVTLGTQLNQMQGSVINVQWASAPSIYLGLTWLSSDWRIDRASIYMNVNQQATNTIVDIVVYECDPDGLPGKPVSSRPLPLGSVNVAGTKTTATGMDWQLVTKSGFYYTGIYIISNSSVQMGMGQPLYGPASSHSLNLQTPHALVVEQVPAAYTQGNLPDLSNLAVNASAAASYGMYVLLVGAPAISVTGWSVT